MHESVTIDRIINATKSQMFGLENPGICINCGSDQDGCEPDARKYVCESCDSKSVYGAQELLFMMQS